MRTLRPTSDPAPMRPAAPGGSGPPTVRWSVRRSFLVAVAALSLAALLDAEALRQTASGQPFGWRRDVAMAFAEPLVDASRVLHLTTPRHWLEDRFGRPSTRPQPSAPIGSTTTTVTTPSTEVTGSTSTSVASSTTTTVVPAHRVPTADDPLRLLVVGDSMTEALGPALLDATASTGVIDGRRELQYSSGLTRPDYFDWPANLQSMVAAHDAEAVIVMLGANDAQGIQTASGAASFGSEAWLAEYRARVASVMEQLTQDGRLVYWIGQPIMRSSGFDERMRLITDVYRQVAARHPGVRFIATRELFSDGSGSYDAYLPDASGQRVLVRRGDGIHFTPAGADRLAPVVMDVLAEDWELDGRGT